MINKNKKPTIKLLSLDLDGTSVLHDYTMSSTVKNAILAAEEQGIKVVINTGRWYNSAKYHIEILKDKNSLHATCNGSVITDALGNVLSKTSLDIAQANSLVDFLTTKKIPFGIANEHDMYTNSFSKESHKAYLMHTIEKESFADMSFISKLTYRTSNPVVLELPKMFNQIDFAGNLDEAFFETWSKFANKGIALAQIANYYNIDISQTMAIGDSYNDIPMLKMAGVGVAMENGYDEVKKHANLIAPPFAKDGVAYIIKEYILK